MPRRKVIADSEDEEEGDDVLLLQPGGDCDRPEPEPLSPRHRPSSEPHNQSSGVTDPSFFTNVYDNQQTLAVQQSDLVENIVRQSQRASASSGDVSLPAKKRPRANPSSGTDVTSPMVLSRPGNHTARFADDASEFTTPRKSNGQEWEIPSSPEDATASQRTKCSTGRGKTHGERKREKSTLVSSPAAAVSAAEDITSKAPFGDVAVEDQLDEGLIPGAMSTPAAQSTKLSHDGYILPDTTKFYIAQSNLTTMQKLEYQKVNVSSGYGGLPGSFPHQKSSGATTIAYSTPSGYSSIPPLPGDEPLAQPAGPQWNEIINISSSPNMVDSGFDLPNERAPVANMEIEIVPSKGCESPTTPRNRTPASKGKKRAREIVEEDELRLDDAWDPDGIDAPRESSKSRATKRRSVVAKGFADVEDNMDTLEDISKEVIVPTQCPPKFPTSVLPDTDPFEPEPEALPRKRGRKKKQPAPESPPAQMETNEGSPLNQDSASPKKAPASEPSPEKKKKKRGRPRKSEILKAAEGPLPEPPIVDEHLTTELTPNDNNSDQAAATIRKQKDGEQKTELKKSNGVEEDEVPESKENRLALKEVDKNLRAPSKSISTKEPPTTTGTEAGDDKPAPKTQLKENPKLGASQAKVTYRVGLSRRSRIAPLLKSIRK